MPKVSRTTLTSPYAENMMNIPMRPYMIFFLPPSLSELSAALPTNWKMPQKNTRTAMKKSRMMIGFSMLALTLPKNSSTVTEEED
jgi:hypothetical protein